MRLPNGFLPVILAGGLMAGQTTLSQTPAASGPISQSTEQSVAQSASQTVGIDTPPERPTYTVPAGTKVLLHWIIRLPIRLNCCWLSNQRVGDLASELVVSLRS